MSKTSIEWTDHSVNPIRARDDGAVGHYCEKISPGCANCYASAMQKRFWMPGFGSAKNRGSVEVFLDESKLHEVLRRRKPTKYFWCDMTDMFGEWVPFAWIDRCFAVMALTPHHTHQVLTKRPERMAEYWSSVSVRIDSVLAAAVKLTGVWLGTSCEDQQRADERREPMRKLADQGWLTFVSYEPALENVCWDGWEFLSWLIVGGESGSRARPFDLAWARNAIHWCEASDTACFVKQLGARPYMPGSGGERDPATVKTWLSLVDKKGGDPAEWPEDLRVRQMPKVVA